MKHFLTAVSQPSVSIFHPALHCSRSTPQDTEDTGWNVGKSLSMGRACSPSPLFILWSFSFRLKEIPLKSGSQPACDGVAGARGTCQSGKNGWEQGPSCLPVYKNQALRTRAPTLRRTGCWAVMIVYLQDHMLDLLYSA